MHRRTVCGGVTRRTSIGRPLALTRISMGAVPKPVLVADTLRSTDDSGSIGSPAVRLMTSRSRGDRAADADGEHRRVRARPAGFLRRGVATIRQHDHAGEPFVPVALGEIGDRAARVASPRVAASRSTSVAAAASRQTSAARAGTLADLRLQVPHERRARSMRGTGRHPRGRSRRMLRETSTSIGTTLLFAARRHDHDRPQQEHDEQDSVSARSALSAEAVAWRQLTGTRA